VSELIARAVETVEPIIQGRSQVLTVELPEQPPVVDGDCMRLTQAIANVLGNAAKYTDTGGSIVLQVCARARDVEIRVRDTGIGIPAEVLPKIFDLFTQLDQRMERPQSGLGIGLALVRRLVEMHGGSVSAHSEGAGRGSEFVICLPLMTPAVLPAVGDQLTAEYQAARPQHRRILVADDNLDALESLAALLALNGHEVHRAQDGAAALQAAMRHRPEVIFLDIGMPQMDGYEVARRIRAHEWGKELLLIAVTGWGQESDRQRSFAAGFDFHLVKPVDLEKLNQLLSKVSVVDTAATPA
jgi:CheY-like chemotaxis protein/anti-sigma regulatory factor (Ser/Thr protein kinase)